jgi:hypothetical protein
MRDGEEQRQLALLHMPVGIPGSGYARYAAAMHFNRLGRMSDELLEIYRICCKHDDEDPRAVAVHEGIGPDLLP